MKRYLLYFFLSIMLFSSNADGQTLGKWRWDNNDTWEALDDKQTHFFGNGFGIYSFIKAKSESKKKAFTCAVILNISKELWDSVVPYEQFHIFGGAGGSFQDMGYTQAGIFFAVGMDFLIPQHFSPQTKSVLSKIPVIGRLGKKG